VCCLSSFLTRRDLEWQVALLYRSRKEIPWGMDKSVTSTLLAGFPSHSDDGKGLLLLQSATGVEVLYVEKRYQ
jgi:hypothetical protein